MNLSLFWKTFSAMLAVFMASKLIIQTDLIMIAPLGETLLAAYAAPARIMLLDAIVAFGLGPVVSVLISGEKNTVKRGAHIRTVMSLSLYLGLMLMLTGLLLYPRLLDLIVENKNVVTLATPALIILTLSIPLRLMQFIGTMVLYGIGRGQQIIPYLIGSIVLNATLNFLFIYVLKMGFTGCYVATFLTAVFELAFTLYLLREELALKMLYHPPQLRPLKTLLGPAIPETLRLICVFGVQFAALALYASRDTWLAQLSAYAVGAELYVFLLMPLIAAMRSTAVVLAQDAPVLQKIGLLKTLLPVFKRGIVFVLIASLLLTGLGETLGTSVFHLSQAALIWWQPFVLLTALALPLTLFNALQRGAWQSQKRFGSLFYIDAGIQWGIIIPCIAIGLHLNNAWIAWSWVLLSELTTSAVLLILRNRLIQAPSAERLYWEKS